MIAILEVKRASLLSNWHWMNNILADVIVGMVALPLVIAFVIASGVRSMQGIYAAIMVGDLTSLFGCFASAGAIASTTANIRNGASSLLSSIVHTY